MAPIHLPPIIKPENTFFSPSPSKRKAILGFTESFSHGASSQRVHFPSHQIMPDRWKEERRKKSVKNCVMEDRISQAEQTVFFSGVHGERPLPIYVSLSLPKTYAN